MRYTKWFSVFFVHFGAIRYSGISQFLVIDSKIYEYFNNFHADPQIEFEVIFRVTTNFADWQLIDLQVTFVNVDNIQFIEPINYFGIPLTSV